MAHVARAAVFGATCLVVIACTRASAGDPAAVGGAAQASGGSGNGGSEITFAAGPNGGTGGANAGGDGGIGGKSGAVGGAGASGAPGGPGPFVLGPCEGAVTIVASDGTDSGFVICADGGVDRVRATTHASTGGDSAACPGACGSSCIRPAFCGQLATPTCTCLPGCASDADCAVGSVCDFRGGGTATCAPATCTANADCPSGRCGDARGDRCAQVFTGAIACRTAVDTCASDEQCGSGGGTAPCTVQAGSFLCDPNGRGCGPPF